MAQTAFIVNRTAKHLEVRIEPLARSFEIEPGGTAEIEAEVVFENQIEFVVFEDNSVSLVASGCIRIKLADQELNWP